MAGAGQTRDTKAEGSARRAGLRRLESAGDPGNGWGLSGGSEEGRAEGGGHRSTRERVTARQRGRRGPLELGDLGN